MPGVFRPYTLVDVLGTMNQENGNLTGGQQILTGFGQFAEADESATVSDSATGTLVVASTATWDNTVWGEFTWS